MIESFGNIGNSLRNVISRNKDSSSGEKPSGGAGENGSGTDIVNDAKRASDKLSSIPRSVNPKTVHMVIESNVQTSISAKVGDAPADSQNVGGQPVDSDHFTPEKLAGRLRDFAENVLENQKTSTENPQDTGEAVKEAVSEGIENGKDELGGNLQEPVRNLVDKIESQVKQSLSSFVGNLSQSNVQGLRVNLMQGQQELNQALNQLMAQQNQEASQSNQPPTSLVQ